MNQRMQWVYAAALWLAPLAASAQSPAPKAGPGAAPPALAPAMPGAEDDMIMVLGDLFGPGDELAAEGPGDGPLAFDDGDDPGPPPAMAWDDDGGGGDGGHRPPHGMGGPRGRGMMMRRGMGMRFAALDLTDAQRDKLRDIHEAAARKGVQRNADMQLARMDLRKLMRGDAPSTAAVSAQIDKITRLQADGMKAHFDTFMQARAVLTPEQLKKLKSGPGPMQMRGPGGHGDHGDHSGHGED
jgi:Spy/CpxP family protein refolding chaperone